MPSKQPKTISEALKPQPRRQIPSSADKSALKAYNAGQPLRADGERLPYQEPLAVKGPPRSFQEALSPGRFQLDTRNGVLSSRGGASGGGMGSGSGGGGGPEVAFAAEAMDSEPRVAFAAEAMAQPAPSLKASASQRVAAITPAASGPKMGPIGSVFANAAKTDGDRMATGAMQAALQDGRPQHAQAMSLYQQSLKMPRSVGEAMRAAINGGDLATAKEAALAGEELVMRGRHSSANDAALADKVWEKFHMRKQAEEAVKAEQRQRYHEVAQRNTKLAQQNSASAQRLGLDPLADPGLIAKRTQKNLGLADSATLRRMAAEDPSNGAIQAALTQALERERKHNENTTRNQAKLDQAARDRKDAEARLEFERQWMLKDLETRGKAGAGRGGVQSGDEVKQMNDAWRDYNRNNPGAEISKNEFRRQFWDGYSPGLMGRVEELGYNALSGLANVAGAPLRAAASIGQGQGHVPPGDSRFPQGLQSPQPSPEATPIPPGLETAPPGIQPVAWNNALAYYQDLNPEERDQLFAGKTLTQAQQILSQAAHL